MSDLFKDLSSQEYYQILAGLNHTETEYPNKCVHELFELQVERTPDSTAIVFGNERLTYRQLNEQANKLAHFLKQIGVSSDIPVGLFINRSVQMVIGLLGILKSGGAYLPYDPTYPNDRLAQMFKEVPVSVLLTEKRLINQLPDCHAKIICLDASCEQFAGECSENLTDTHATLDSLAYAVFTSGSTGKPKATAVYHRGWTNLLNWFVQEFKINPNDKVLVISSFSFDITQRSIMMPLVCGGELHILASDYFDQTLTLETICSSQITLLNCAPSSFYALVEMQNHEIFKQLMSLRKVFLGGEPISASRLENCVSCDFFNAEFINVYGVAECSDVSTFYRLYDFEQYISSSVPIGKPIFNTKIYLVDENLNLVPFGDIGELCIAGDGIGRGYLNDPISTEEKFVFEQFNSNSNVRLYKTGDLARYRSDGNLEYSGRLDYQVKIRGQRIELGEIETSLRQHPEVKEAVVIVEEITSGDQRLVAYIVCINLLAIANTEDSNNRLIDSLRNHLIGKMPHYMVPNEFIFLREMPLNPNGKIDRKSLLNSKKTANKNTDKFAENTKTSFEVVIAGFFIEALKLTEIDFEEDFFKMGGHSLLAAQILLRMRETFDVNFDLSVFLSSKKTSVKSLANLVMEFKRRQNQHSIL
ncbi:amino acid adenylation domain-containing protein [Scytonema sp. UIC 10036]|uniref:amino acid adenylation domain-containing protein n=1 Tax=Scytonema sp. UIC 10036 TaxID=2304196 RepID=UPI0012DA333E|nr:amino acid adenylation domain-containing protein [Scytonema sp. UIC 10036]